MLERREQDELAVWDKGAEALDLLGTTGARLANVLRPALRLLQLQANGEITRQQPEANSQAIGMQPIADQMIEIVAVEALLDGLFGPPPLPVGLR